MQERFGKTKFIYSQILERQSLHSKRGHKEGIMVVCSTKQGESEGKGPQLNSLILGGRSEKPRGSLDPQSGPGGIGIR